MTNSPRFIGGAFVILMCIAGWAASAAVDLPPAMDWQKCFGGTADDVPYLAQPTADGGLILGGETVSGMNGNKAAPGFGGRDFWVIRLDKTGSKLWEKTFGGTGDDVLFALTQTSDGGFLLGGQSDSPASGNKTAPNYGLGDMWLIRIDSAGNRLWDMAFGAADDDGLFSLIQTGDGGFICAGYSYSTAGGNKTSANYGDSDFWVVRVNGSGIKLWDRSYGGSNEDTCYSVQTLPNGGFLFAGSSASARSETKSSVAYGGDDIWVVRTDINGSKLWDRSFGGTGDDGYYQVCLELTPDGGFLVGADSSSSTNGNKSSIGFGLDDFWVIRCDGNGSKLWERCFGGSGSDFLTGIARSPNGGFLLCGGSTSPANGSKTAASFGSTDCWVVRIDDSGNSLWDQSYGGVGRDAFYGASLRVAPDGTLVIGCDSESPISGNKSAGGFGGFDYWVLKTGVPPVPPVLGVPPSGGLGPNGFAFSLQGRTNGTYRTEFSGDLLSWRPLVTNTTPAGTAVILDPGATNAGRRYYRALEVQK